MRPNPQETADLVSSHKEIRKSIFCAVSGQCSTSITLKNVRKPDVSDISRRVGMENLPDIG